jgi:predicted ribosomally synthesized peptide with nif11-like leader
MSKENLEQFMDQVADSGELQAQIGEGIDAESLIALGAEHGCEFTAAELQEAAELSDDELDEVAGGRRKIRYRVAMRNVRKGSRGLIGVWGSGTQNEQSVSVAGGATKVELPHT